MKKSIVKTILLLIGAFLIFFICLNPISIVYCLLCFSFGIIIHEFGHLFFGLFTGYEFLYFRVFFFVVYKNQFHKIRIRMDFANGMMLGQCLLAPKSDDVKIQKTYLYNYGGIIFNYLTVLISFILLFIPKLQPLQLLLLVNILISIFLIINNQVIVPKVCNDGKNYQCIKRDDRVKKIFFHQLLIMKNFCQNHTFSDLKEEYFEFDYRLVESNPFVFSSVLINYYRLLELKKWEDAKKVIENLMSIRFSLLRMFQRVIVSENLFFHTFVSNNDLQSRLLWKKLNEKEKKWFLKNSSETGKKVQFVYSILTNNVRLFNKLKEQLNKSGKNISTIADQQNFKTWEFLVNQYSFENQKVYSGNYHTHSHYCGHGYGEIEDYIKFAKDLFFVEIGISEHAPPPSSIGEIEDIIHLTFQRHMKRKDLNQYFQEVNELKEKEKDIRVLLGLEVDYFSNHEEYYSYLRKQCDYLILGQHTLYDGNSYHDTFKKIDEYWLEIYEKNVTEALRTGYFHIFAHPEVILLDYTNSNGEINSFDDKVKDMFERILKVCKEENVLVECNLGRIKQRKQLINDCKEYSYPRSEFLLLLEKTQTEVIIGADAHRPNELLDENIIEGFDFLRSFSLFVKKGNLL